MKSLTVLKPGGLAIGVAGPPDAGFAAGRRPDVRARDVLSQPQGPRAARDLGVRYSFFFMQASGSQLEELGALYDSGPTPPAHRLDLLLRPDARSVAYVESGKAKAGKVVITLD